MTEKRPTPTLHEVYRRALGPEWRAHGMAATLRQAAREAIGWLSDLVGHPATPADLEPGKAHRLNIAWRAFRLEPCHLAQLQAGLFDLWSGCARRGLCDWHGDGAELADAAGRAMGSIVNEPAYVPTPAEIAEACASIRAGWSRVEEAKRRGWSVAAQILAQSHTFAASSILDSAE